MGDDDDGGDEIDGGGEIDGDGDGDGGNDGGNNGDGDDSGDDNEPQDGKDATAAAFDAETQGSGLRAEEAERSATVRRSSAVKEALRSLLDSGLGVFGPENCRTFCPHYS